MSELLIHRGEWVVVCDGAKALVLENAGDAKFPNLKTVRSTSRRIWRPMSSAPTSRAAPIVRPGTAPQCRRADRLARPGRAGLPRGLAQAPRRRGRRRQGKSLILVAPPRALGMIRPAYSHALRAAVRTEVDKDLVKLPVHEIEKHLTAA